MHEICAKCPAKGKCTDPSRIVEFLRLAPKGGQQFHDPYRWGGLGPIRMKHPTAGIGYTSGAIDGAMYPVQICDLCRNWARNGNGKV